LNFFKRIGGALFFFPCLLMAAESGVLRIGCLDFPSALNPVYATSETAQGVMNKLHQALFILIRMATFARNWYKRCVGTKSV